MQPLFHGLNLLIPCESSIVWRGMHRKLRCWKKTQPTNQTKKPHNPEPQVRKMSSFWDTWDYTRQQNSLCHLAVQDESQYGASAD